MSSNSVDLIDKVLNCVDAVLAQGFLNDGVVDQGDSLLVDLSVSSLEDEFSNGLSGGVSEGDVGFDSSDEVGGGFVHSHEGSVVDLSQSENSEDSDDFGVEFVNTSDSHDEGKSGLGGYVDLSG